MLIADMPHPLIVFPSMRPSLDETVVSLHEDAPRAGVAECAVQDFETGAVVAGIRRLGFRWSATGPVQRQLQPAVWDGAHRRAGELAEEPVLAQEVYVCSNVVPGMVAAIQTFGELLHWHPHFHVLLTCGAFTPQGEFLELPELDLDRLQAAWQEAVFALYLAEEKIEPEVVENMRT